MNVNIEIPEEVSYIISELERRGYEAYTVGGCVRDSFLGDTPEDWDICTSALPVHTKECFAQHTVIETGLKHGTVTLVLNRRHFEITTYRVDGKYSDNRRPDEVEFVSDLKEDLSRRDFTVNAMAYNPQKGLVDYFDGISDLNAKIIRCVGSADKRFQEDALRVMRAMRFASTLGFSIDESTSKAIFTNKKLLRNIAAERISAELNKLITGTAASRIISEYAEIIAEIIPEVGEMIDSAQRLSLWKLALSGIDNLSADVPLRLAMLLKDIAATAQTSSAAAKKILHRLKYNNITISDTATLILYHSDEILPESKHIKRQLHIMGENMFRRLIELKKAIVMAEVQDCGIADLEKILSLTDEIINRGECYSLKDLAVNGNDLINAGIAKGNEIGRILRQLLNAVIEEQTENNKDKLLNMAKDLTAKHR